MPQPTPPSEQALRQLADAVDQVKPRVAHDLSDPDIPVAATVILLRDGSDGLEVLMIERPDRGSFAGAWVFPGGKLEDSDRGPLGDATAPEEADGRRAAVRETREETGLEVDEAGLVTLSVWDPPPGIALRIRTWFFLIAAPGGELRLQPDEAVTAEWLTPAEALQRHARGEFTLYPPTWVTLHGLQDPGDVDAALAGALLGGIRIFETQVRRAADGPIFYWREDAEYEEDRPDAASGPRHRLEVGHNPWIYTRRD